MRRNLNNAWFHFSTVRARLCSQIRAWLTRVPEQPGGEWLWYGKLGLALEFAVSCKHPMRDWWSIAARGGVTPQGTRWHASVWSKYLNSNLLSEVIFPPWEAWAEETVSQTQGGSSGVSLCHSHFLRPSLPRGVPAASCPFSRWTPWAAITAFSTSWSTFVGLQPHSTVKPKSIFSAFLEPQLSQHLRTWVFLFRYF